MAVGHITLLDIKKLDAGIGADIVNEALEAAPEVRVFPNTVITGTSYDVSVQKTLPPVGFRILDQGSDRGKGTHEVRSFQAYILDHQVAIDKKSLAYALDSGRVKANHMRMAMQAGFITLGKQIWTPWAQADQKGFPGIMDQYDPANMELDAEGTSDTSDVWMLYMAESGGAHFITGEETTINMEETWVDETVYDADGKPYQAETNWMTARFGFALENLNAAVRIKNVGTGTAAGTLENLLFRGRKMMVDRLGMPPNVIFWRSDSQEKLRSERTATNATGQPVPVIENWQGIPTFETAQIPLAA